MIARKIRDHKFKIIFIYEFLKENIEEIILNYFENFPYEEDDDIKDNLKINESDINMIKDKVIELISKIEIIDSIIKENVKNWELNRLAKTELIVLRLAIFEMFFDDSIKDYEIAINEAVEFAKIYGEEKSPKFVNGLLGTIVKNESAKSKVN